MSEKKTRAVKQLDANLCQQIVDLCNDPALWKTMNFAQVIQAIQQAPTVEIEAETEN